MKRFFFPKIFIALFLLLLPIGAFAGYTSTKRVHVGPDQKIEGNFLAAGEEVVIEGSVEGDVIVAGGLVVVSGSVAGDIIAAGGQVNVTGPVQGDIRIMGGDVTVDSVIGKNATLLGGNVRMTRESAVGWGVMLFAGNADIAGKIERDLRAASGTLHIDARIGDDVFAKTGALLVKSQTRIGGDMAYTAEKNAEVLSGAVIGGEVKFTPFEKRIDKQQFAPALFGLSVLFLLIKFIGFLILGLIMLWFIPKHLGKSSDIVAKNFWASIGKGLAALVLTPLVSILLMMTLIGFPLALLLLSAWMTAAIVGSLVVALTIGEPALKKLLRRHWRGVSHKWSFVLGLVLLFLISLIPFIGWLLVFLLVAAGTGGLLTACSDMVKRLR